ncbi:MAG: acyloxyacyl hydrolase [Verrucomicrobiales bacterium]|nr:acyloxyacyl hydrolase [Verrucomicrobiales bacterium]
MTHTHTYSFSLVFSLAITLLLLPHRNLQAEADETHSAIGHNTEKSKDVLDSWFIDFETAGLWKVGNSTDLDYVVLPQTVSWRYLPFRNWKFAGGDMIIRNRLSFLAQYFAKGAESYYLGFSGGPTLEWWNEEQNFSLYFYIGGGAGWVDSTDIIGGQGQDFTFNWYMQAGAHFRLTHNLLLTSGLSFQHLSNQGQAERNPGLNSLGPTIGLSLQF